MPPQRYFYLSVLLVAMPWLMPFAPGPSPATVPLLFSWACGVLLLWLNWPGDGRSEPSDRLSQATTSAWLLAALVSTGIALIQYFGFSAELRPWISQTPTGEAFANLRQRNQFATLTNIGLVCVLWADRSADARTQVVDQASDLLQALRRAWPIVLAALLAGGNAASSSRTGMLQLAAIVCLAALYGRLRDRRIRTLLLVSIAVYGGAALALPVLAGLDPSAQGMFARLTGAAEGCQSRLLLWSNVQYLIALKPWAGWGWGELDYAHFTTLHPGARFCDILDNAHNLPLQLAVELGLPVAVLVLAVVSWLLWRARPWRETAALRQLAWVVLALIGLHSMLEYPLWYGPFQLAALLALWMLWQTGTIDDRDGARPACAHRATQRRRTAAPWISVAAASILAALAYAGWDYWRVSQIYRAPDQRAASYRDNTLEQIQQSWLFRNQVRFAELTLSNVTADNASNLNPMAHALLHFSPEARVVQKLIESALALGRRDEAAYYMLRYRHAYPLEYARWSATQASLPAIDR